MLGTYINYLTLFDGLIDLYRNSEGTRKSNIIMKLNKLPTIGLAAGICLAQLSSLHAQTWFRTSAPSNSWTSVAISADGSRLVACGGLYIYTSTNYGSSWVSNNAPLGNWMSVASSADGTKLAACSGYIYTNSGTSWGLSLSIPMPNFLHALACSADGARLLTGTALAIEIPNNLYTSGNAGVSWTVATNTPPQGPSWAATFCSADGTRLAAVTTSPFVFSGFFSSADSGATWSSNGIAGVHSLAGSEDGRILLACGQLGGGMSTNWGTNWSFFIANNPSFPIFTNQVACSTNGTVWFALGNTNIFSTFNSGATWTTDSAPALAWSAIAVSKDGTRAVAASSKGGIYVAEPTLGITSAAHNVALFWSTNYPASEFGVEQNTNLTKTNWMSVSGSPAVVNTSYQLTLPATNQQLFFRLSSP